MLRLLLLLVLDEERLVDDCGRTYSELERD
jgi:hypothetical protein